MSLEYHAPRVVKVEGSAKDILGEIAELLFDHAGRGIKIELSSEGTLYWEGKITKWY